MAATRWLTFDCYGTIADWNSCMLSALEPVAGAQADALLGAYHRAESILEAGPQWRPYRDVLTDGLTLAAAAQRGRASGRGLGRAGRGLAGDGDLPRRGRGADRPGPLRLAAGRADQLRRRSVREHGREAADAGRGGGDGGAGAVLQAGPGALQEVRRADRGDPRELDPRRQQLGARHPAGLRMGLRSVWVDRDRTGHPAKFAERRITAMRRLPETVLDVSVLPAWSLPREIIDQ